MFFTENRAAVPASSSNDTRRAIHPEHRNDIQEDHQVHPGEPGERLRRLHCGKREGRILTGDLLRLILELL